MGVGGEGGSVRAKLMESLPVIKQINEEFRDPVSVLLEFMGMDIIIL